MNWEERYNTAIREFLADHMTVLKEPWSIYGRTDWSADEHMLKCLFDPEMLSGAQVEETTVWEFAGTFEDSDSAVVLHIEPVSCMCGHIKNRKGEWQGSFQDLITAITGDTVSTKTIHI